MANAYKDENGVSTLIASSSADGFTPVRVYADPTTHRLLTAPAISILTPTGAVDGANQTFVFTSAPKIIVVDQGRTMQQTSSDSTVNWTGTTTVVLSVAPTFDIFGY